MIELENLENLESGLISSKLTKESHLGSLTAKSHKSGARQDLPIPACRARWRREVADAMLCDVRCEILEELALIVTKGYFRATLVLERLAVRAAAWPGSS